MEFLFTSQSAWIEAIIMFACIFLFFIVFAYDGYLWIVQVIRAFHPRKAYVMQNSLLATEGNPLPENAPVNLENVVPALEDSLLHNNEEIIEPVSIPPTEEIPAEENETQTIESISPEEIEEAQSPTEIILPDFLAPIESETNEESPTPIEELPVTIPELDTSEQGIVEEIIPEWIAEEMKEVIVLEWETEESAEEIVPHVPEVIGEIIPEVSEETYDDTDSLGKEPPIQESEIVESVLPTIESPEPIESSSIPVPEIKAVPRENTPQHSLDSHTIKIHPEKKEKLIEIVNMVRTLIARWHIDEARAFIVSGLAIDKNHRDLNLLMASLFERDHMFEKAEFIFKDLAIAYPDDIEILTHLATSLAMQRKYEVSYELYKKLLTLKWEDEETLYTLTHLASELWLTEDVYLYGKSYLKQYPRNPEILWLYSQSLITRWERKEAIEILIKLKNLTPYNQEIVDLIGKLVTEEELAGNFWGNIN